MRSVSHGKECFREIRSLPGVGRGEVKSGLPTQWER